MEPGDADQVRPRDAAGVRRQGGAALDLGHLGRPWLLVGRPKQFQGHPSEVRAFEGRLDELAVYARPLTPEEIRRHAKLRAGAP